MLSLLTTLPVGYASLEEAATAFYLVPVVGLLEGLLVTITLYVVSTLYIDDLVMGGLYVVVHLLLTGGIHLDGFADYSDVIGSRASGSRAQAILKDPRRGSYAIAAMAVNMLLSLTSTSQLINLLARGSGLEGFLGLAAVMSFVYVISAESMFLVLSLTPPEPYEGIARLFSFTASRLNSKLYNITVYLATLTLISLPLALTFGYQVSSLTMTSALLTQALLVMLIVRDSRSRLGFANGDVAGFTFELTRVSSLTVLAVVLGWYWRL